ncbi:3-hydroxybutyryl-CoA dehydrogenase [Bartonella apis]|uniref:3-hydroxybutyryl-CoA dehydrogenase n=1 Tax=Bartonella apis TaxID=1686310 RepID=UPI00095DC260|nr:3-hydroxybutyryl-CoA dehydrogenase [Bartonella apis]OLY48636.1 3-hydroxybutyryl-CoA dehydrogenase [Bartonella apis]
MIKTVAIVGAGQMGGGIVQTVATAGFKVLLYDISAEQVEHAISTIKSNLAHLVKAGKMSEQHRLQTIEKLSTRLTIDELKNADLIIEAASEDENIKRDIFISLCENLAPATILATNTSTISITRLAATTNRPEKFIGTHFMNPVPQMKLVEVVRGIATSEETYSTICDFVTSIGKTYTVTEDFPAFIVNRVLVPMINEAIYALYEGVGDVNAIDTAMKLGANHPMGPLELADFIGLDVCLAIMHVLHQGLSDSKYRPCPLLIKYVEAGWLGRKSGRGFYDYSGETPVPTR